MMQEDLNEGINPVAADKKAGLVTLRDRADDALFDRQARICQVLADTKRLRLLELLRTGELSVGELAERLGLPYPNVSQHLNVMRDAGLVATRRAGTSVFYRLAYPRIGDACDIVREVLRAQLADAAAVLAAG
jgi:ArsR family transcriptional regulator, virulence genes transcriptional regulator